MSSGVLLIGHGTVESLSDLPQFLANIRRGHAAPPELVQEVRRRYEAMGGRSPLTDISLEVARKLEARLGVPVRLAMRLWKPYPADVLDELCGLGVSRVAVVPLAQHSAAIYADAVREAAAKREEKLDVVCSGNWGGEPLLTKAFAAEIDTALGALAPPDRAKTTLILTAHSLPLFVVRGGDPYESEVRASAEAVVRELGPAAPEHVVAFQSQGMSGSGEWLGPDLRSAIEAAAARGRTHVIVAPIGFLADHVEILYDLDIEAVGWAKELGIRLARTRSLNAGDGLLGALEAVARRLLGA